MSPYLNLHSEQYYTDRDDRLTPYTGTPYQKTVEKNSPKIGKWKTEGRENKQACWSTCESSMPSGIRGDVVTFLTRHAQ